VDWTDLESFSRPPPHGTSDCADPEASWGHRKNNLLRDQDELFFGYYPSAAIMVADDQGPPVPELARRMSLSSCRRDPVPAFAGVLTAMPQDGIALGDVLADSGYSHRIPQNRASPLRTAGASLIQDLHPSDRGPRGTHAGAIIANGNLYCPATPPHAAGTRAARPHRHASAGRRPRRQDRRGRPLQARPPHRRRRRRLPPRPVPGRHGQGPLPAPPRVHETGPGPPGDPAAPEHPQACCEQQTITVPPGVGAKTRQKHDYPSAAWRRSYARRTGAERGFATAKDPASNDITRGWCRLMGLAPLMLFTTVLLAARNQRILAAWDARQEGNARRAARGLPPKTRRRRRKTLTTLAATAVPP
jgi:hypothetical protein